MRPIIVSLLPRRGANPKWHTLSQIGFLLLFAKVNVDAPYHCFSLEPPRGKPKIAYPITAWVHCTFCDRQSLCTLLLFLSCAAEVQVLNGIAYHSLALCYPCDRQN